MNAEYSLEDIYRLYDRAFPEALRCDWDNDGLMLGFTDNNKKVGRALFTLDVTTAAAEYAIANNCDLIVSHHPVIFHRIGSVTDPKLLRLLGKSIAVISFHTRLDAADGGVNDTLASLLGLENVSKCEGEGIIRHGYLQRETEPEIFAKKVAETLDCPCLNLMSIGRMVRHVAVCGGDGKDFLGEASGCGCDTYVAGNLSYNMMADASGGSLNLIEAGHFHTENPICARLEKMLTDAFPGIETLRFNSDPVRVLIRKE